MLATAALTWPATAIGGCPDGQPCIVVRAHGSVEQTYVVDPATLDQIGDVTDAEYRTNNGRGAPLSQPSVAKGASVGAVLRKFDLQASATRVIASAGPSAYPTQLDAVDLDGGQYQSGLLPVFFSDSPEFIRFARPMRTDHDVNVRDVWSGDSDSPVYLDVYTSGHVLHPVVTASASSTRAGVPLTFHVGFLGRQPSGATYAWSFGDGTSGAAAAPSHAWRRGGSSYAVNLTVHAADESAGTADPVTIRVGQAPKPTPQPTPKPGTGTAGPHHPVTGPAQGGGTTANGASTPAPPQASATPAPSPRPHRPKPRSTMPAQAGERVQGVLLVNAESAPTTVEPPRAVPHAASARAVPQLTWDRRLLWFLVLPGLLILGAATQTRWLARRLPLPRWRAS